jgi:hypothetical protein
MMQRRFDLSPQGLERRRPWTRRHRFTIEFHATRVFAHIDDLRGAGYAGDDSESSTNSALEEFDEDS